MDIDGALGYAGSYFFLCEAEAQLALGSPRRRDASIEARQRGSRGLRFRPFMLTVDVLPKTGRLLLIGAHRGRRSGLA
jgi:hypothetical protein